MSWWEQDAEGNSLVSTDLPEEKKLMWGDGPADIIDNALAQIKVEFLRALGRMPSRAETIAGIAFSTRVMDELAEVPEHAPYATEEQAKAIRQHGYSAFYDDERLGSAQADEKARARHEVLHVLRELSNEPDPEAELLSEDDLALIRAMKEAKFGENASIVLPSGRTVSGPEMAGLVETYAR